MHASLASNHCWFELLILKHATYLLERGRGGREGVWLTQADLNYNALVSLLRAMVHAYQTGTTAQETLSMQR